MASVGCGPSDRPRDAPSAPLLRDASSPGRFTNRALVEASGLLRSSREPNVFWSHNDSGNDERLFAFDSSGRALGAVRIGGARNQDWEAIALGPCAGGACVYIGDVGDNGARRAQATVVRVPEPTTQDSVSTLTERVSFRYADGPRDVESIWVAPDTSVYLLTKRPDRDARGRYRAARLYRIPASAWHSDAVAVAAIVDSLPIVPVQGNSRAWITDAALSPPDSVGARWLAVRSYTDVYVFGMDTLTWRPTTLIAHCSLSALRERVSGEGITWLADGRLMFDAEGEGARLHTGRCP